MIPGLASRRRLASCWSVIAILAAMLVSVPTLLAHPGSSTAVVITPRTPVSVEIALHTDARALVAKLEAVSNAPLVSDDRSSTELADRIRSLAPVLLTEVVLKADTATVPLVLTAVEVDGAGQAVVRINAAVAPDTQAVTWSTSLAYGAYPVSLRSTSGVEVVRWLQGHEESESLPLAQGLGADALWRGVWLGFTHILPKGLDHILFVVGLVLFGTRPGPLLAQVSAFTVAHSVTLGLCLYSVVALPSHIVEPLIGLSVAYVGIENLYARRLTRWRVIVVFAFGLLHGLGFAEALAALDLSRSDLLATLISFNVGVELGQLTVVAAAWLLVYGALRTWQQPAARLASAGVAIMGVFWTVQRIFS